jgi:hypothetical protein
MAKRAKRKTKKAKKAAHKAAHPHTHSTSEVGNAKNVAHFSTLINYCTSYGTSYNPSAVPIQIPSMNATLTAAQTTMTNVINNHATNSTAINNRLTPFAGVKKLATRMLAALVGCGATKLQMSNAKTINHKIQGKRVKAIVAPTTVVTPTPLPTEKTAAHKKASVAQLSFDNQIQHIQAFIALLSTIPAYNPNETDLKIAALNTYLAGLNTTNNAAVAAHTNLANSLIARNKALYTSPTSLCTIAEECKAYVKSVYGASAVEYKQVRKLVFRTYKG